MDGRQRLKLSLTNRSIGLILPSRRPARSGQPWAHPTTPHATASTSSLDTPLPSLSGWFACALVTWWSWRGSQHPIPFRTRP